MIPRKIPTTAQSAHSTHIIKFEGPTVTGTRFDSHFVQGQLPDNCRPESASGQKRKLGPAILTSVLPSGRDSCTATFASLFDHPVGAQQE